MKRVLILCTANSARSPRAEGLLRARGGGRFEVHSAGAHPTRVRQEAIAVMAELGIDISGHWSKSTAEFADQSFDFVITVCDNAKDVCPVFPGGATYLHWSFADPAAQEGDEAARLAAFRGIRDQMDARFRSWLGEV